ncbi:hypothetical protein EVAR_79625_1 [Eumeta japonica]|uniref:Uncharacterized protein n=1 Tax=Eumeta variegata TaxID=151549 RepID=A0A4C1UEH8_EUMVA|nr:hypothetical protein EVAR_79625_1 [Eumeta japonica]
MIPLYADTEPEANINSEIRTDGRRSLGARARRLREFPTNYAGNVNPQRYKALTLQIEPVYRSKQRPLYTATKEIDASLVERLGRSCLSIVPRSLSHARLRRNATMSHVFSIYLRPRPYTMRHKRDSGRRVTSQTSNPRPMRRHETSRDRRRAARRRRPHRNTQDEISPTGN